jgi:hypothetical protein
MFISLPNVFHLTICMLAAFGLDFYTEVGDLEYLVDELDQDAFGKHHRELNAALCSLVQDYSLVSFTTLNIMVRFRYLCNHFIHASF